jgi:hypothetical protein
MNELMDIARQTLKRKKSAVEPATGHVPALSRHLSREGSCATQEPKDLSHPGFNWLQQWRNLAQVAGTVSEDDPRYTPTFTALADCEAAFRAQDEKEFIRAAERATRIAAFVPGSWISWRDEQKGACGPATALDVIYSEGRLWVWLEWEGTGRWLNEILITRIEPKEGTR